MNDEKIKESYEALVQSRLDDTIDSMELEHNNISGVSAHLRDAFLESEKEYVLSLLQDESLKDIIIDINRCHNAEDLLLIAQEFVDKVENNLIPYEEMETIEKKLTILLAAIKDKVLVNVKEKYYEEDDFSYGRSR